MTMRDICTIALVFLVLPVSVLCQTTEEEKKAAGVLTHRIVVLEKRLPEKQGAERQIPANATVITREQIEASSAATIQDLLSEYAGIIFFDNVGNGAQSTIALRGFGEGRSVAVFVDGIRVNEPDDNSANLEFIDLDAIERIEIIPGSAGYNRGSGATAGTINIVLRQGEGPGWTTVTGGYGNFETREGSIQTGGNFGNQSIFFTARTRDTDGFRDNGKISQKHVTAKYGAGVEGSYDFSASVRYHSGDMGNPGALTAEELAVDRQQNPYNIVDFTNSEETVLSARYDQFLSKSLSTSLLSYYRTSDIEVLTTGRYAALFGGFATQSENTSTGFAGQVTWNGESIPLQPKLTAGVELQRDDFSNTGFFTDLDGNHTSESSDRSTNQDTRAFFADGTVRIADMLMLQAAVRHDIVELSFSDDFSALSETTEFSETTAAAGASFLFGRDASIFFRYSQSFQTPTVNDLFAFPLFGSNPDLQPTSGETYEGGIRLALPGSFDVLASVYRMDLEDEVVFVITDPLRFIGRNENIGESRRTGLDASLSGKLKDFLRFRAGYSYIKARNLSLEEDLGIDELLIPLVPEHKFTASARLSLGGSYLSWTTIYVGEQVMSSDSENRGDKLESYFLNNLVTGWDSDYWGVRIDVRNVTDEEFSTRAIYSSGIAYFTPTAGRNVIGSLYLRF